MKRLQILIDEDLDAELERLSGSTGRSKGALIREFVRKQIVPLPSFEEDPLFSLAGAASFPQGDIDSVVYGELKHGASRRKRRSRK
ncbi:MAG TPA: CopG family transcriptional regulator [Candidatus Limnocylindria bacterium]|nr:CopG family transcriptional regulator [Candidatus Limnocylindria bacterium]